MQDHSTIIALSTPEGTSAIGVIRLSGENAISITDKLFSGSLSAADSHTLHHGFLTDGDQTIDEVVVGLFKNPKSYTGEDVIEISCHGSQYVLQKVLELFVKNGVRMAGPGEFTQRAFLNGKLDLSQAEAVMDLIASDSAAAHEIAINHLRGGFKDELSILRDKLLEFVSLVELELDFSEEDVEFANRDQLMDLIKQISVRLAGLIESFKEGSVIREGIPTVIAGRPNAGKSTLLNALLKEERALVSDIAGTTRDTVEEKLVIGGLPFRLIDTAGIRDAGDKIEAMGIERTKDKLDTAGMVLYLFDAKEQDGPSLAGDLETWVNKNAPLILIGNKADQLSSEDSSKFPDNILWLSAKTGEGINTLKDLMLQVAGIEKREGTVVANSRHAEALIRASSALVEVLEGMDEGRSGDMLAIDIHRCVNAIGEITGEVTNDEVLGSIFGRFCIGK